MAIREGNERFAFEAIFARQLYSPLYCSIFHHGLRKGFVSRVPPGSVWFCDLEIVRFQELRDICCNDGRRRLPDLLIRNGERRACSDSQDEVHARVPLRMHRELFSCRWPRSTQPGCMPMPDLPHDGAGFEPNRGRFISSAHNIG